MCSLSSPSVRIRITRFRIRVKQHKTCGMPFLPLIIKCSIIALYKYISRTNKSTPSSQFYTVTINYLQAFIKRKVPFEQTNAVFLIDITMISSTLSSEKSLCADAHSKVSLPDYVFHIDILYSNAFVYVVIR